MTVSLVEMLWALEWMSVIQETGVGFCGLG